MIQELTRAGALAAGETPAVPVKTLILNPHCVLPLFISLAVREKRLIAMLISRKSFRGEGVPK